jgi:hypothetical protein
MCYNNLRYSHGKRRSPKPQITILYDAFGKDSAMQKDWGYAALVEYGGKRILFDSGNNPEVLVQNAKVVDRLLLKIGLQFQRQANTDIRIPSTLGLMVTDDEP